MALGGQHGTLQLPLPLIHVALSPPLITTDHIGTGTLSLHPRPKWHLYNGMFIQSVPVRAAPLSLSLQLSDSIAPHFATLPYVSTPVHVILTALHFTKLH
ncbi:hypothetical protein E2C01_070272 [Portunus trituberculatus]|uniref:Uncharacterized protein n=1 Tax=Portunus trituberculatus TaxID=210409 RepID=A0A5B7I153_PORTR|nr:hypothetical protein [Portunus trituberculatus]